jgi:glutathione S-transferase
VPVLDDNGAIVFDSNAILVYLAQKYDTHGKWLPRDAKGQADVQAWLSVAAGLIAFGPAAARLITVFGAKYNPEDVIGRADGLLKVMDAQLAARKWLVGNDATLADIACYSYIAAAPEGNVNLSAHPNVQRWLSRIEALPGFVPMQKTKVGLAA